MRQTILLYISIFVFAIFPSITRAENFYPVREISLLSIKSAITPASFDYLKHNFSKLPKDALPIIQINTPGGLVTTTKDIITLIGELNRPVVVWISPEGASASSAGAIIASAAHFILMAPGSNMGAATPVGLGKDIGESDGRKKAMNDLTALVRSLSQLRGRPPGPFEEMIKTAQSYTDKEALKLGIINGIVSRHQDIPAMLEGKKFFLKGKAFTLKFETNSFGKEYSPSIGQKILDVLANPQTAYFLFLIGIALIYFEFQAPGGYIAGSIGLCFIILAAIAFQVLPLNWGSFALILVGVALFIMEIFVTSYGLLSVAGLVSFVMGSLFLFHGESGFISVKYPVLLSTLAGVIASVGLIVWLLYKEAKKQKAPGNFFLPENSLGVILTKSSDAFYYQVKVRGEIWKAQANEDLSVGDKVIVTSVDQKQLLVNIQKVR